MARLAAASARSPLREPAASERPPSSSRTAGLTSISDSAVAVWRSSPEISASSLLTAACSARSCLLRRALTLSLVSKIATPPSTSETTSPRIPISRMASVSSPWRRA